MFVVISVSGPTGRLYFVLVASGMSMVIVELVPNGIEVNWTSEYGIADSMPPHYMYDLHLNELMCFASATSISANVPFFASCWISVLKMIVL